jgi:hypothetical protein
VNQEFAPEAKSTHFTPGTVARNANSPQPRILLPDPQQMVGKLALNASVGSSAVHATVMIDHDTDDAGPQFGIAAANISAFKLSPTNTICVGKVSLYNVSKEDVADYSLYLVSHGHTYPLKTFVGTLKQMKVFKDHYIASRERVSVPIYTDGYKDKPGPISGQLVLYITPEDNRTQKIKFTLSGKIKTGARS